MTTGQRASSPEPWTVCLAPISCSEQDRRPLRVLLEGVLRRPADEAAVLAGRLMSGHLVRIGVFSREVAEARAIACSAWIPSLRLSIACTHQPVAAFAPDTAS